MFAFVVSVSTNDELIVTEVAVDEIVTFVPAMMFVDPSGKYPRAFVMFPAVKLAALNGVYPRADVMFAALNASEFNGV